MHAIEPPKRHCWLPPMRIRWEPFREFDRSFSEALAELESRHATRRVFTLHDRQHSLLKRRPR